MNSFRLPKPFKSKLFFFLNYITYSYFLIAYFKAPKTNDVKSHKS